MEEKTKQDLKKITNTSNKKNNTSKKAKKKLKVYLSLIAIIVIILILIIIFFKFKDTFLHLIKHTKNTPTSKTVVYNENATPLPNSSNLSNNSTQTDTNNQEALNLITKYLEKLQQNQLTLQKNLNSLQESYNKKSNSSQEMQSLLNTKIAVSEIKNTLKLISLLKTNKPFYNELNNLKGSSIYKKHASLLNTLNKISKQGVETNTDLLNEFNKLEHDIILKLLANDNSTIGKIKFYIAKFVYIKKISNFNKVNNSSISYTIFSIKNDLENNNIESALNTINNSPIKSMGFLSKFINSLSVRANINNIIYVLENDIFNYSE